MGGVDAAKHVAHWRAGTDGVDAVKGGLPLLRVVGYLPSATGRQGTATLAGQVSDKPRGTKPRDVTAACQAIRLPMGI